MKKNKKGFTLIELLVVISIISLLSSVVMASVTGARNKAKEKAFRSEIMQLVNALELYRNDNQDYPSGFLYAITNNNSTYQDPPNPVFKDAMDKYMKTFPNPRGSDGNEALYYWKDDGNALYRCKGSLTTPKYVIIISNYYWGSGFEDWPTLEFYTDDYWGWLEDPTYRCFSLI